MVAWKALYQAQYKVVKRGDARVVLVKRVFLSLVSVRSLLTRHLLLSVEGLCIGCDADVTGGVVMGARHVFRIVGLSIVCSKKRGIFSTGLLIRKSC